MRGTVSLLDLETTRPRGTAAWSRGGVGLGSPPGERAPLVGVAGARGGAGASTLAAVLAARLARDDAAVLVDLDHGAGGVDLLLGIDEVPGVRWPDLAGARGDVPGDDLIAALPRWGRCAVLAAGRPAGAPDPGVVEDVLRALGAVAGAVVADLGRGATAPVEPDVVVLVVPRDVRGVACGVAARDAWVARGRDVVVVARGPAPGGMGVGELAQAMGARVAASVPSVRGIAADVERVGLVVRRPLARVADRLLRHVGVTA